jgi:hypothetical protein
MGHQSVNSLVLQRSVTLLTSLAVSIGSLGFSAAGQALPTQVPSAGQPLLPANQDLKIELIDQEPNWVIRKGETEKNFRLEMKFTNVGNKPFRLPALGKTFSSHFYVLDAKGARIIQDQIFG